MAAAEQYSEDKYRILLAAVPDLGRSTRQSQGCRPEVLDFVKSLLSSFQDMGTAPPSYVTRSEGGGVGIEWLRATYAHLFVHSSLRRAVLTVSPAGSRKRTAQKFKSASSEEMLSKLISAVLEPMP